MHCVTKFSLPENRLGRRARAHDAELAPPAAEATHVMVWAEYGYSANLRLADLLAPTTLLATHRGGRELTPEHGFPLRMVVPHLYAWKGPKWVRAIEYLTADRRGFWEERGYHNIGDPWQEQRYSYQED
jgi:DMSO/TMAO reductase YedYZ molybdopterin-dependent catalytic subunit